MRECNNPNNGIKCTYSEDSDGKTLCVADVCIFREINYIQLMRKAELDVSKCK